MTRRGFITPVVFMLLSLLMMVIIHTVFIAHHYSMLIQDAYCMEQHACATKAFMSYFHAIVQRNPTLWEDLNVGIIAQWDSLPMGTAWHARLIHQQKNKEHIIYAQLWHENVLINQREAHFMVPES